MSYFGKEAGAVDLMETRGLVVDDKLKAIGPLLFQIWVQFNIDNEPANCYPVVWIPKTCGLLSDVKCRFTKAKPKNPFTSLVRI